MEKMYVFRGGSHVGCNASSYVAPDWAGRAKDGKWWRGRGRLADVWLDGGGSAVIELGAAHGLRPR